MAEHGGDASVDEIADALQAEVGISSEGFSESLLKRAEILNGVHSNAAGIQRYLRKRSEVAPA
jgi:hypothetical protein